MSAHASTAEDAVRLVPPSPQPRSAYVHVPFCAHRCGYCDFTLVAGRDELIDAYLRALQIELAQLGASREVDTLYIGGGTPTHLPVDALARLFELVLGTFELAAGGEFTVEANPAGFGDDKMQALADAGVNRVSLGVQSFDADVLRLLERDHRPSDALRVIQLLKQYCDNISLDLIFAVPGQTLSDWRETLEQAVLLEPQHVSTYGLTFEKGTAFWSRLRKGALVRVADDLEREMYALAMDELASHGFEQYEISSHARPGYHSRHNTVYWRGLPYYGVGPGAARYIGGRRETNHRSVTTWIKRVLAGEAAVGDIDELSAEHRARELLVLGMRTCAGVDCNDFAGTTGFRVEQLAGDAIGKHVRCGLIEQTPTHIRLTREGRFLADTVCVDLL